MKKGIRALFAAVMAVVMLFVTVACGNGEGAASSSISIEEQSPVELATDENKETVINLYKRSVSNSKEEFVIENPEYTQIKGVAEGAFAGNSVVRKIILPNTIEHIDRLAFRGCGLLEEINFPSNLTTIGSAAFMGTALKEVILPATVTTIETMAFANNTKLEKITINEGVIKLENIVEGANNLKELHLPSTIQEIAYDFTLSSNDVIIYTPDNSVVIDYCTSNDINYEIV